MAQRIRIGELLVRAGVVNELQLRAALSEQHKWGGQLGKVLVDMGFVDEATMVRALSKQLRMPRAKLDRPDVPADILRRIDPNKAREKGYCPERFDPARKVLTVAMVDPTDVLAVDDLAFRTGFRIETTLASESELVRAVDQVFFGGSDADELALENEQGFASMSGTDQGPFSALDPSQLGAGDRGTSPIPLAPSAPPSWGGGAGLNDNERFVRIDPPAPGAVTGEVVYGGGFGDGHDAGPSPESDGAKLAAAQKRQNRAIRAMLDMLIERGVFTEEEFRARLGIMSTRSKR